MEMTREIKMMDKDKAWDKLVEYMWENEEAHWIEEGRPNDNIFIALKTLNRFLNTTIEDDSDSDSEDEDDSDSDDEPEHEHDKRIEESELDRKAQQLIDLIIKKTNEANEEYDDKNKEVEELICANACSKNCFEVTRYFECKHPCCIKTVYMCGWCIECGCNKRLGFEMMD